MDNSWKELFTQLQNKLAPSENDSFAFSLKNVQNLLICKENFQSISKSPFKNKVFCVDSGSSPIISTPAWSLYYLRVCGVIFDGKKTKLLSRIESYVLISSSENSVSENVSSKDLSSQKEEIISSVSFFSDHALFSFSKEECTLKNAGTAIDVISFFRRYTEIRYASSYLSILSEGDLVLLDGTLQSINDIEEKYLENLCTSCNERKILVGSIAKSCTILTQTGKGIISVLGQLSPMGAWVYFPCVIADKKQAAHIFFAKLHEKSKYIFRIELSSSSEKFVETFFSNLSFLARDPVFLGYPYVLVEVDMFARVTNEESVLLRYDCMRKAGRNWDNIISASRSINAHSVLDTIH